MSEWTDALGASRVAFIDGLEQRGFSPRSESTLGGVLDSPQGRHYVEVHLPQDFPFAPPRVIPEADYPRSWHRELDGAMCLYPSMGREQLPWLDPADFVATVQRWLHESDTGWTNDSPDLDLDRYFDRSIDSRLLIYKAVDTLVGRYVRFTRNNKTITLLGVGSVPRKAQVGKNRAFGFVASIGEPSEPPTNWDELADLLDEPISHQIGKAVKDRRLDYLLVTYQRRGNPAVLALETHHTVKGIELRSVPSASDDIATLTVRSGAQAAALHDKKVLVLGVGAIGSFLCDSLSRAGLGHMTIRDHDIVRPGNLVRHLATSEHLGHNKAHAVRAIITGKPFNTTTVEADDRALSDPREVPDLLNSHDLVIDASADGAATAMLAAAARATGHHILSVCLKDNGDVVRLDVIPPMTGQPLPQTPASATPTPAAYEAGCGDPVSLTPPHAVQEAAALATRHAIGLLTGNPTAPAGDVRDYR